VRRFTAEYLETTRAGMWADSREALADLQLGSRVRVLDVGAGTGELTAVLRAETDGEVVALDADPDLLVHAGDPAVVGDATRLPLEDNSVDLVVCQALLVNLADPVETLREFARISTGLVAVVEPDNSAVTVESTVDREADLASRARQLYLDGASTDPAIGDAADLFAAAGLEDVTVRRYDHERRVEPPYSETALEDARRKASGSGLDDDRETILDGDTTAEGFDQLREAWRTMGRAVVEQMQAREYRRCEVVPFYVTVGTVDG
jgi:SAM-dependent methyltransferase